MGVDLELCVDAHGHDVDLTIKASLKLNYSLGISSSYIWDLAFLQSWFRPYFLLDPISQASENTCLLQINTSPQPLCRSTFEFYPPVSREYQRTVLLPASLHLVLLLTDLRFPPGSELLVTREHR